VNHLLLTTISAVVLEGCATTEPSEPPTAKAPDIPLWQVARIGHIEAVKKHLTDSMDVNAKSSRNGSTPLHQAVRNGHKEIVELLIANGADVNSKDEDGQTPLDWAIQFKESETIALIRKHGGKTGAELKAEATK
jgi:ankyrin repeat protein